MAVYVEWKACEEDQGLDPFNVQETLEELDLGDLEVKAINNGKTYVIKCNENQRETLLKTNKLTDGKEIKANNHTAPPRCRCVIRCPALDALPESRILEQLAKVGVTKIERRGRSGLMVLGFNSDKPPSTIKVGPLTVPTASYIPRPTLCHNCYAYGHNELKCKNVAACKTCGQLHKTTSAECTKPAKCVHCKGAHLPTNTKCPAWRQEMHVNEVMVTKNITRQEAVEKFNKVTYIRTAKGKPKTENAEKTEDDTSMVSLLTSSESEDSDQETPAVKTPIRPKPSTSQPKRSKPTPRTTSTEGATKAKKQKKKQKG